MKEVADTLNALISSVKENNQKLQQKLDSQVRTIYFYRNFCYYGLR